LASEAAAVSCVRTNRAQAMSFGKLRTSAHAVCPSSDGLPGPCSYSPDVRARTTKGGAVGIAPRLTKKTAGETKKAVGQDGDHSNANKSSHNELFRVSTAPGPGTYDVNASPIQKQFAKPSRVTSVNHKGPTVGPDGPGPGRYAPSVGKNLPLPAKDFGMSRLSLKELPVDLPGPGQYKDQQRQLQTQAKGGAMGKDPRTQLFRSPSTPAPDTYNTRAEILPPKSVQQFGFSKFGKFGNSDSHLGPAVLSAGRGNPHLPGPGAYTRGAHAQDDAGGGVAIGKMGLGAL